LSPAVALLVFAGALLVTLAASEALVRGLDRLGARLGLSEGLLGLLTALGADAPEISSALAALHAGRRDVGLGVVLGSNIFNLAALLGVGALLAGRVHVRRAGLLLDGGVAVLATLVVAGLTGGVLAPIATAALLLLLFVPYCLALGAPPRRLARLPLPRRLARLLALAVREVDHEVAEDPRVGEEGAHGVGPWGPALFIPIALALIVGGSLVLVAAALTLAAAWRVPDALVGTVALAALTSLPNAYAAARLALQGRGAAVVSETLNSNTINVLAGIALPALIFGGVPAGGSGLLDLLWLLGMTAAVLALLARRRGLTRPGGVAIIALYVLFVARVAISSQ
jgi:cation:H+ antiporter